MFDKFKFDLNKAMAGTPVTTRTEGTINENVTGRFVTELKTLSDYRYVFAFSKLESSDQHAEEKLIVADRTGDIKDFDIKICMKPPTITMWFIAYTDKNISGWLGYWTSSKQEFEYHLTRYPNSKWTSMELPGK